MIRSDDGAGAPITCGAPQADGKSAVFKIGILRRNCQSYTDKFCAGRKPLKGKNTGSKYVRMNYAWPPPFMVRGIFRASRFGQEIPRSAMTISAPPMSHRRLNRS